MAKQSVDFYYAGSQLWMENLPTGVFDLQEREWQVSYNTNHFGLTGIETAVSYILRSDF